MARDDLQRFDPALLKMPKQLAFFEKVEKLGPGPKQLGWVPFADRTDEQNQAHEDIVAMMPEFKIGGTRSEVEKMFLWDFAKAVNNNEHFLVFHQESGSCVGNGGGQAVWYLSAVDQVMRGEAEVSKLPFYLYTYGKGRERGGLRGRGEGSFGAAQAEAEREDGNLFADTDGLPQPKMSDSYGITWGSDVEMDWSDGAAIAAKWDKIAKSYIVKTTAQARSANDVRNGLMNGYPTTIASDWGGQMRPPIKGSAIPVLLNTRADTWQHQMCIIGCMKHPEFGWIYYILNSWGPNAHGKCPTGAPPGGFWVQEKDVEYIVRQGDSFIYSGFEGFPAREIEKALFKLGGTK